MRSERTIEASRIVTFTKPAITSPTGTSSVAASVNNNNNVVNLLFMAHAARPASPYADPSLKVDYVQQPAVSDTAASGVNASIQQVYLYHEKR